MTALLQDRPDDRGEDTAGGGDKQKYRVSLSPIRREGIQSGTGEYRMPSLVRKRGFVVDVETTATVIVTEVVCRYAPATPVPGDAVRLMRIESLRRSTIRGRNQPSSSSPRIAFAFFFSVGSAAGSAGTFSLHARSCSFSSSFFLVSERSRRSFRSLSLTLSRSSCSHTSRCSPATHLWRSLKYEDISLRCYYTMEIELEAMRSGRGSQDGRPLRGYSIP